MRPEGGMEKLLRDPTFTRRLVGITFDEVHCISKQGGFHPEYRQVNQLCYTTVEIKESEIHFPIHYTIK